VIEELLKKTAQNLDKDNIPYMIIGGQAVLLYGTPRLTRDIDITLGVDTDKFPLIKNICDKLGLKILPEDPEVFAKETKVLPAEELTVRIRVDFIFSFTPYESQAISRAQKISINNYPVKFAACEDVIIHKMIAARAIDIEDVKNILLKQKTSIDLKYIQKWLLEFEQISEQTGISEQFNGLLKD
jgi:predicted nucleotidyltransferase